MIKALERLQRTFLKIKVISNNPRANNILNREKLRVNPLKARKIQGCLLSHFCSMARAGNKRTINGRGDKVLLFADDTMLHIRDPKKKKPPPGNS